MPFDSFLRELNHELEEENRKLKSALMGPFNPQIPFDISWLLMIFFLLLKNRNDLEIF
jgi:hypothetical protein